ncbi:MAG: T9SS type A sorting domain-containing protein, partial [Candidatus Eisenbacteria bacterium]|nr:T9SS type A sorting domain-containing protein [Candidatus Eisenbacteria bacterium]
QRVNPDGSLGDPVTAVAPAVPRATLSLSAPQPSPASHASTLRFALSRAADARLEVLDAAGRRVRALASGAMTAGEHSVSWDLRDAAGAAVQPGWYVVRLTSDGQSESHPIVVRR